MRNIRYAHDAATDFVTGAYPVDEYYDDLLRVTQGNTDKNLSRFMIEKSLDAADWMQARGVKFQPPLSGTIGLDRTNAFFKGGGKAVLNAYYATAARLGIDCVVLTPEANAPASHVARRTIVAPWDDLAAAYPPERVFAPGILKIQRRDSADAEA